MVQSVEKQKILKAILNELRKGTTHKLEKHGSPYLAADALKLYLGELPEPLLVTEHHLFDCWMAAQGVKPNDARQYCLKRVIALLPAENRAIFKSLTHLLNEVDKNAKHNQMNAATLAEVFAPLLLGDPSDTSARFSVLKTKVKFTPDEVEKYLNKEEDIVRTIIKQYQYFWSEKDQNSQELETQYRKSVGSLSNQLSAAPKQVLSDPVQNPTVFHESGKFDKSEIRAVGDKE